LTYALPILFVLAAALSRTSLHSYSQYVHAQESRAASQLRAGKDFLYIDRKADLRAQLRQGQIFTERIANPNVPSAYASHWLGAAFFPGATIAKIKQVDQDYDRYDVYYAPDILKSKLLSKDGERFHIYYRLKKKKVLTAVFDTKHEVVYTPVSPTRLGIASRTTEVREVQDAGEPDEKILPAGEGSGFLYAMNSLWRMEEADGGVYIECEAITLARSIPFGIGAVAKPIIEGFAVESLQSTLEAKKRAVAALK
jgi:hypothetical protein